MRPRSLIAYGSLATQPFAKVGVTSALILAIDQWLKYFIYKKISGSEIFLFHKEPLSVKLQIVLNKQLAFGLAANQAIQWALIAAAVGLLIYLAIVVFKQTNGGRGLALIFGLIAGAALSNIGDRLFRGGVVDFIHLQLYNFYWPAFNLADVAIVAGAIYLIVVLNKKTTLKSPN